MFVIRDATTGQQTYAASRFLIAEPAGDKIVLDFNRAHTALSFYRYCDRSLADAGKPLALRRACRRVDTLTLAQHRLLPQKNGK